MPLRPDQVERLKSRFPTLTFHPSCTIEGSYFEGHVSLAQNVTITASRIGAHSVVAQNATITQARLGNHVRIGANARIHPNVTIGNNSAIEPGASITHDLNPVAYAPSPDPDNALPLDQFLLEKLPLVHVFNRWAAAKGDASLRLNYALTENSRVLDVGGYRGDFAHDIAQRYNPHIDIFEPIPAFAYHIQTRFQDNPKIKTHAFGLAATTRSERISLAAESSSILRNNSGQTQTIQLQSAKEFLDLREGEIDLLKINIEGCEYELLEHLLKEDLLSRIRHLQIQFHDFVANARQLRRTLRNELQKTHQEQWNYPFIWESWQRLR